MRKFLLGVLALIILTTGIVYAGSKGAHKFKINFKNKNILVAYYSYSGNTKYIAEHIQMQTGGDIFEITPLKKYPSEKRLMGEVIKFQKESNILPELKENIDVTKYDIIFVGTPVWYSTIATPVKTFLSEHNFKNKIIIPFATHGGGGGDGIVFDMDDATNGEVIDYPLIVLNKGDNNLDNLIKDWLKNLR